MVHHGSVEVYNKMTNSVRRKSDNGSELADKVRSALADNKKYDSTEQSKYDRESNKLDIGEHYMVKRGDSWRKLNFLLQIYFINCGFSVGPRLPDG